MSGILIPAGRPEPFDDRPVLVSAPLRPGCDRAQLSRYEDAVWDLGPAVFRENVRRCHVTVRFDGIHEPALATTLKAYLYARLNFSVPGLRARLAPTAVRASFNKARRFLTFVIAETGALNLKLVDQPLLDAYLAHLRSDPGRTAVQIAALLEVIVDLHLQADLLPDGGICFSPWRGRTTGAVTGVPRQSLENLTPRIPEPVIASLLAWSLKYVTVFAPDILAGRVELTELQTRRAAMIAEDAKLTRQERLFRQRARLEAYFDRRRREGRGMPVWSNSQDGVLRGRDPKTNLLPPLVNASLLHLHAGVDAVEEPSSHLLLTLDSRMHIQAAAAAMGVEVGGMNTPISTEPETGRPWRPRFDVYSLKHEERMLQAACYVVCAYLTGMRDSEVQAMRAGCLRVTRSEDGLVERYRLRSTVYKGRVAAQGEAEEWITVSPVAEAIRVLDALTLSLRQQHGGTSLWRVLRERKNGKEYVGAEIVRTLNTFRDHLNTTFGSAAAPAVPHGPDGRPWRLTTRQFRRTVAWHIANRPFGTVAGKLQYKHASVAAFEGYAGSSPSGFRREVERERASGQLDDVLAYFERHRHGLHPAGPAAARIGRELNRAAGALQPLPGHVADQPRLKAMLASLARTLYPGVLSDCFFDPDAALCLRSAQRIGVAGPVTALCEPTRCANSCITGQHRPAWAGALTDVQEMLRTKRLSEHQRTALQGEAARFRAVLEHLP